MHYWKSRAYRDHNLIIRQHYNFRIIGEKELGIKVMVMEKQFKLNPTYSKLEEVTYKHLYTKNIEPRQRTNGAIFEIVEL